MIKIISILIITCISQLTYAKVIELDNHNITYCQEQLKNNNWEKNIVLLYVKDSPGINKFRKIYQQVSTEFPQWHLFALNVFNPRAETKENQIIWKTVKACLTNMMSGGESYMGDINAKTPAVLLYDYAHEKVGLENHGLVTKNDILKFIRRR